MVVLANSPAGVIEPIRLKRREQRKYWRPQKDKEGQIVGWLETHLLPCDPVNKEKYLARGFRLYPPGEDPKEQEQNALLAENARLQVRLAELERTQEPVKETAPLYVKDTKKA